jgi:hypothetical protein
MATIGNHRKKGICSYPNPILPITTIKSTANWDATVKGGGLVIWRSGWTTLTNW